MKKIALVILSCLILNQLNAQLNVNEMNGLLDNYDELCEYVYTNQTVKEDEFFMKKFARHDFWWQHRAGADGGYDQYPKALIDFVNRSQTKQINSQEWENQGPRNLGQNGPNIGRANSIWINPIDPTNIKIGSASAGLWETNNSGVNWTCLTPHIPGGVSQFIVHPTDSDIVYGILDLHLNGLYHHYGGFGIFVSTDGGANAQLKLPEVYRATAGVKDIKFKPGDPSIVYALAGDKVYISSDSFENYTAIDINGSGNTTFFEDIAFSSTYPNIGYAYSTTQLYKTIDGGYTWTDVYSSMPEDLGATWELEGQSHLITDNLSEIFVKLYYGRVGRNIMNVIDDKIYLNRHIIELEGSTYKVKKQVSISDISPLGDLDFDKIHYDQYFEPLCIKKAQNGIIYFTYQYGIYSYNPITNTFSTYNLGYNHADIRDLESYGSNDYNVITANDGGITYYTGINNKQYINGDICISEVHGHAILKTNKEFARVGTHDNGGFYKTDAGWFDPNDGLVEGAVCWQNQSNFNEYAYAVHYTGGQVKRGSTTLKTFYGESVKLGAVFFQDPHDPNSFWKSNGMIFEKYSTTEPGMPLQETINALLNGTDGAILAFAESNPNIMYASIFHRFHPWFCFSRSFDGGQTWDEIGGLVWDDTSYSPYLKTLNRTGLRISDIEVNPTDDNEIWLTFSRFQEDDNVRVIHSTDAGMNWNDITGDLPDIPITQIEYHALTNRLFIGSDIGLYEYNNDLTWSRHSEFPIVPITRMTLNDAFYELSVATYGRGIWTTNLSCANNETEVVIINTNWDNARVMCSNTSVLNSADLTINAETEFAPRKRILVNSGSKLVLNAPVILNGGSNILLKDGSELIINSDQDFSEVLSKLIIEGNAVISVNNSATLKLGNELDLASTNDLKFTGNGTVEFLYDDITIENVQLTGSSGDLVIKANGLVFNVSEFASNNVVFYPEGELTLEETSNINIQNTTFDCTQGTIHINNPNTFTFEDSEVRNAAGIGLKISNTENTVKTISNCDFLNNQVAIQTYGGGLNIEYSSLNNNAIGWEALNMSAACKINDSELKYNTTAAVSYQGYNEATLKVYNRSNIGYNANGVSVSGPLTLEVTCSSIHDNTGFGVKLDDNANIDVYKSFMDNNDVAIDATDLPGGGSLFLNSGYTDLTSNSYAVNGFFMHSNSVRAFYNKWNLSGTSPQQYVDYLTYFRFVDSYGNYIPFSLVDNMPISAVPQCSFPPFPGKAGEETSKSTSDNPKGESLEALVANANQYYKEELYAQASQLYYDILMNHTANLNISEWDVVWYAYLKFQSLSGLIEDYFEMYDILEVQNSLLGKLADRQYDKKLYLNIAKAQSYRISGDFGSAFDHYLFTIDMAKDEDKATVARLMCQMDADQQVVFGNIESDEIRAFVENCTDSYSKKIKVGVSKPKTMQESYMKVNPNPANSSFKISIDLQKKFDNTEVKIVDQHQQVVWHKVVNHNPVEFTVNAKSLGKPGIYFIVITSGGKQIETKRLIVQ
jgi:hypothetical protein